MHKRRLAEIHFKVIYRSMWVGMVWIGGEKDGCAPSHYLHPVVSIAVNGLHAVVIAPVLVRVDMLRKGRTYEVLITEHKPGVCENGSRPKLESTILVRGVHGRIELDLWGKDKTRVGSVLPTFYSLGGEPMPVPKKFVGVLKAAASSVNCLRCTHSHYLLRPKAVAAVVPASVVSAVAESEVLASAQELIRDSFGTACAGKLKSSLRRAHNGDSNEVR